MILNKAIEFFNDDKFNVIEALCKSNHLSLKSFEVIGDALGDHVIEFEYCKYL